MAPPAVLYIRSGTVLEQLTSPHEVIPITTVLSLIALGALALLPVLFKDRLARKLE